MVQRPAMFTLQATPQPDYSAVWRGSQVIIRLDYHELVLSPRSRADLGRVAHDIGTHALLPFSLTTVLAWIARRLVLPTSTLLQVISLLEASWTPPAWQDSTLTAEELRAAVQRQLAAGLHDLHTAVPAGAWDRARWLVSLGEQLWQVRGAAAAPWSGYQVLAVTTNQSLMRRMKTIAFVAELGGPRVLHDAVPLPPATGATLTNVWMAWSMLAAGPEDPPAAVCPDGLGHDKGIILFQDLMLDALTIDDIQRVPMGFLSVELGAALCYSAAQALAACDQPRPRFVRQVLDVPIPRAVLPELEGWPVHALRIVPDEEGLWVAPYDAQGNNRGAFWWRADVDTVEHVPLLMPPVLWPLLHAICACLWRDLCADAQVIQLTGSRTQRIGGHGSVIPRLRKARHLSIPVKIYTAEWLSDSDREALRRAHRVSSFYRRLPDGWQERGATPAGQLRRQAAAERAAAHGAPPPPMGYTFVQPQVRGIGEVVDGAPAPVVVRAEGLFQLALGLKELRTGAPAQHTTMDDQALDRAVQ